MTLELSIAIWGLGIFISVLYSVRRAITHNINEWEEGINIGLALLLGISGLVTFMICIFDHKIINPYWYLLFSLPGIVRIMFCDFSFKQYIETRQNKKIVDLEKSIKEKDEVIKSLKEELKIYKITNNKLLQL